MHEIEVRSKFKSFHTLGCLIQASHFILSGVLINGGGEGWEPLKETNNRGDLNKWRGVKNPQKTGFYVIKKNSFFNCF